MISNRTLIYVLLGTALHVNSQQFKWATTTGNSNLDVVTDSKGNILSTGIYTGTKHFDPGPQLFSLTSLGDRDIVVFKQDPDGKRIWAKSIGGAYRELSTALDVDANDNVYVTGWIEDTTDLDPGPATLTIAASPGFLCAFIVKLDADGDLVWAGEIETSVGSEITDVRVSGNLLYVAGWHLGLSDFDLGTGTHTLATANNADRQAFVAQYNLDGDLQWVTDLGRGMSNCIGLHAGGIYLGCANGEPVFDPSDTIIIHNLDVSGSVLWSRTLSGTKEISIRSIDADPAGNLVATGALIGTADFNPGINTYTHTSADPSTSDIYIFKWTGAGTFLWSKLIGGKGDDAGEEVRVNAAGEIWVGGAFNFTVDFDPSYNADTLRGAAHSSFLLQLASNGDHIWAGAMYVVLQGVHATKFNGMHLSSDNSIFLTGSHDPHMDADPGPGQYILTDAGAFMIRINGSAPLGVNAGLPLTGLQLYPCPYKHSFFVQQDKGGSRLRLTDSQGRLVFEQVLIAGLNEIYPAVDAGIYTAEVFTGQDIQRVKIVSAGNDH